MELLDICAFLKRELQFSVTVDPRDLDDLHEQLGDIAEEITLPEKLDFDEMKYNDHWGKKGAWTRPAPPKKKKPMYAGSYIKLDSGKYQRIYDGPGTKMPCPNCNQEFRFTVVEKWEVPNCGNVNYKQKFDEIKLRAIAEAQLICTPIKDCSRVKPTKIWSVFWWCKDNKAGLSVTFGFECVGI